jgi:NAD(P)-dependent dehydrogenase (short-subunit alcohol dehydrogenase family)
VHPLGLGTPADVARTVCLASDEARWTTGAIVAVDGGVLA